MDSQQAKLGRNYNPQLDYTKTGSFTHGPGFYLEEMLFKELIGENKPSSYCYCGLTLE